MLGKGLFCMYPLIVFTNRGYFMEILPFLCDAENFFRLPTLVTLIMMKPVVVLFVAVASIKS